MFLKKELNFKENKWPNESGIFSDQVYEDLLDLISVV